MLLSTYYCDETKLMRLRSYGSALAEPVVCIWFGRAYQAMLHRVKVFTFCWLELDFMSALDWLVHMFLI